MTLATVAAGVGIVGGVSSLMNSGSSQGGNTSSGRYVPTGLGQVDTGTQGAFNQMGTNAQSAQNAGTGYLNSLNQSNAINYNPYQQAANQAGAQYGQLAGVAGQQEQQYGQAAQTAQNQQSSLYGAGNTIMNQAMDPNMAQYNQYANQLGGQVNAGQAARGLGNSPVGGQEYNNAMSNFNTQWNTQQLQNMATGANAMGQLNNAGVQQGQLQGANMAAQQAAGANQAGYTQQSGAVPLNAQQYVAQQPGAAANAYTQGMQGINNIYQQQGNLGTSYMNGGISAANQNATANAQQQAAGTQALMTGLNSANSPGSWLNNLTSGNAGNVNNPGTTSDENAWASAAGG